MNLLALKGEVSCKGSNFPLLHKIPRTLRFSDVMLNGFSSHISNTAEELSRTPEMSFTEMLSQPRMLPKKFIGRNSLKQLKSLTNTHCRRNFNKQMHMIRHNLKLINFKTITKGNFIKKLLAVLTD